MKARFEFATASRILFGSGVLAEVASLAGEMGRHALVVTGASPRRAEPLLAQLAKADLPYSTLSMPSEPTIEQVQQGVGQALDSACDVVIAIGGGSVIDGAKAVAGLASNPGEILDYLEVIGRGKKLEQPALPFIAIPTTAGTGAEVTRNAVLSSPQDQLKVSLRSPFLLPRLAVIDPDLTLDLPYHLTATTGLDALTQLIEPFVSCRAQPLTDNLCRDAIPRVARSIRRACESPGDRTAREEMCLASLSGGLALANSGLGAVHGFAAPIGGMFPAPHGAVCAALLAPVIEINLQALTRRQPQNPALQRYSEVARLLTNNPSATHADLSPWVRNLCDTLKIPPLSNYGLSQASVKPLCAKAAMASSMKGNPLPLNQEELEVILTAAM